MIVTVASYYVKIGILEMLVDVSKLFISNG